MTNMEMVEAIREKANVSYEEAKAALERNQWDMLDAMVDLERQGKVGGKSQGFSYSTAQESGQNHYKQVEPTASEGRTEKKKWNMFWDEVKGLLEKSVSNHFVVKKNQEMVFYMPVLVFALLVIFAFYVTVPLLIIGLFFKFRYSFKGSELEKTEINSAINKAETYMDDLVNKYTEKKDENASENK